MDKELIEKCLLILRQYHLPAQTLGKKETYCDNARKHFLLKAIPIIQKAERERIGKLLFNKSVGGMREIIGHLLRGETDGE